MYDHAGSGGWCLNGPRPTMYGRAGGAGGHFNDTSLTLTGHVPDTGGAGGHFNDTSLTLTGHVPDTYRTGLGCSL